MLLKLLCACALPILALAVPPALAAQPSPSEAAELDGALARLRQATEAYHDLDVAQQAGYVKPDPDHCMASQAGIMGYHYLNASLLDDTLELERPEMLVYAPTADGQRKLVNVEYIVPYAAWSRSEPPTILGRDLKRADGMQIWFLHVWVWAENPDGLFANWNPALSCGP